MENTNHEEKVIAVGSNYNWVRIENGLVIETAAGDECEGGSAKRGQVHFMDLLTEAIGEFSDNQMKELKKYAFSDPCVQKAVDKNRKKIEEIYLKKYIWE